MPCCPCAGGAVCCGIGCPPLAAYSTLHATISAITGACGCLTGLTFPINWATTNPAAVCTCFLASPLPPACISWCGGVADAACACGNTFCISVTCNPTTGVWTLQLECQPRLPVNCPGLGPKSVAADTCTPFSLTFNVTDPDGAGLGHACCTGGYTVTITL